MKADRDNIPPSALLRIAEPEKSNMADETLQTHAQNEAGSEPASKPRIPVGSFEILYCEKCGCMIPGGAKKGNAIASGDHWICKKCSRATQGAATAGASGTRATAVRTASAAAPTPMPPTPMRSPEPEPAALRDNRNGRKPSGQRITPMGRRSNASSRSRIIPEQSARGRRMEQDAPLPPADGGAKATKVAMIAVAVVAVMVLGILFMSGGSTENKGNLRTESNEIPKAPTTPTVSKPVETNSGGGMTNQEIIDRLTRKPASAPRSEPPAARPTPAAPAAPKSESNSTRPGGLLSSIGTGRPGEPLGTGKEPAKPAAQPAEKTEAAAPANPAAKAEPEPAVEATPTPAVEPKKDDVAVQPAKNPEPPAEEPKKEEPKIIAPPSGGSILDPTAVPGP